MINYQDLSKSKDLLIVNSNVLYAFFSAGYKYLITDLYENIYVTRYTYEYFIQNLDFDSLKIFNKYIKKINFNYEYLELRNVCNKFNLTQNEAFAFLYGKDNEIDIMLDDPFKAEIFKSNEINTIRPSEIISAALISKK